MPRKVIPPKPLAEQAVHHFVTAPVAALVALYATLGQILAARQAAAPGDVPLPLKRERPSRARAATTTPTAAPVRQPSAEDKSELEQARERANAAIGKPPKPPAPPRATTRANRPPTTAATPAAPPSPPALQTSVPPPPPPPPPGSERT